MNQRTKTKRRHLAPRSAIVAGALVALLSTACDEGPILGEETGYLSKSTIGAVSSDPPTTDVAVPITVVGEDSAAPAGSVMVENQTSGASVESVVALFGSFALTLDARLGDQLVLSHSGDNQADAIQLAVELGFDFPPTELPPRAYLPDVTSPAAVEVRFVGNTPQNMTFIAVHPQSELVKELYWDGPTALRTDIAAVVGDRILVFARDGDTVSQTVTVIVE